VTTVDQEVELEVLLGTIYTHYHYDFRHHVRSVMRRRVARACDVLDIPDLLELRQRIADPNVFTRLLGLLTIQVSDLFRSPSYFRAIRERVVPYLATYPSIKIWVAGCGAGEEAYSWAIVLAEEGLLDRALIYATDIDPESLRIGAVGAYELERAPGFSQNYVAAGGRGSLSSYYDVTCGKLAFAPSLRKRIVVADHCLATDAVFAEVHFVSCRNVLIYFDRSLRDRALGVFRDSLCPRGFVGVGEKESLVGSHALVPFAARERIYRAR
jgi:chemotaxis protein methyltransferase CheR